MNIMKRAWELVFENNEKQMSSECLKTAWREYFDTIAIDTDSIDTDSILLIKMSDDELLELQKKIKKEMDSRTESVEIIVNIERISSSGGRESFMKKMENVDENEKGGYSLVGKFLENGEQKLTLGDIIVEVAPAGSVKNGYRVGLIYIVRETLQKTEEVEKCRDYFQSREKMELVGCFDYKKEFISFQKEIISLLEGKNYEK